jgi:DNA-binding LacI/PurR family transcriptional regulator
MLDEDPTMDAVFSGNDQMALGAIHVMHARGISIPDQIAIVGFDGLEEAAWFTPPLTTIRQPLGELGQMAVREVLAIAADDPGQRSVRSLTLATELIVRESAPALSRAEAS